MQHTTSQKNKRIAKNTVMLYIRMLLIMGVTLYTSRIILQVLGVADYGLYSVVGGVVIFIGFLNTSMASAIQRFLSFSIGKGDKKEVNKTFNSAIIAQIIIALLVLGAAELFAFNWFEQIINIPPERLAAANFVFQFSTFTILVKIITVPFNASIIANEKMSTYAIVSIVDVSLQLLAVTMLSYVSYDKLKLYSFLLFCVAIFVQCSYSLYCLYSIESCKIKRNWDKKKITEMLQYAGWNMCGTFSGVMMDQGINILLNNFFGVIVNAGRAVAFQVNSAVSSFASNFQLAMNPQIVKLYAEDNRNEMSTLINRGSKYSFFLLYFFATPILFYTQFILGLWLKHVPDYAIMFCQLVLVNALITSLSGTLLTGAMATGRIRSYQLVVGGLNLLNVPISWMLLKFGGNPYCTMYVMISVSTIALFARLFMLNRMIGFSIIEYVRKVIVRVLSIVILSAPILCLLKYMLTLSFGERFLVPFLGMILLVITNLFCIYIVGLNKDEKKLTMLIINKKILHRAS